MKILLVNSGGPGFSVRYSYDVELTLINVLKHSVRQVTPFQLSSAIIESVNPELMLVMHGSFTSLPLVHFAKTKGIVTVLWLVEDPYEIDQHRGEMVNTYDYVFTNEKLAVGEYKRPHVYYLPWCCNPFVHKSLAVPEKYQSDLCFVGMGFCNRVRLLNAIAPQIKQLDVKLIGDWQSWGEELHPDLKRFVLPVVNDFWEVQKYYNGAKLNLNIHRDPVGYPSENHLSIGGISPNDRAFALAGCGAFQLVDQTRPALWECFNDGAELVGFSNAEDLGRKIDYYLANPEERKVIAQAAQKKAYAQHTFRHRLTEIFRVVGSIVKQHAPTEDFTHRKKRSGPVSASSFNRLSNSFYS